MKTENKCGGALFICRSRRRTALKADFLIGLLIAGLLLANVGLAQSISTNWIGITGPGGFGVTGMNGTSGKSYGGAVGVTNTSGVTMTNVNGTYTSQLYALDTSNNIVTNFVTALSTNAGPLEISFGTGSPVPEITPLTYDALNTTRTLAGIPLHHLILYDDYATQDPIICDSNRFGLSAPQADSYMNIMSTSNGIATTNTFGITTATVASAGPSPTSITAVEGVLTTTTNPVHPNQMSNNPPYYGSGYNSASYPTISSSPITFQTVNGTPPFQPATITYAGSYPIFYLDMASAPGGNFTNITNQSTASFQVKIGNSIFSNYNASSAANTNGIPVPNQQSTQPQQIAIWPLPSPVTASNMPPLGPSYFDPAQYSPSFTASTLYPVNFTWLQISTPNGYFYLYGNPNGNVATVNSYPNITLTATPPPPSASPTATGPSAAFNGASNSITYPTTVTFTLNLGDLQTVMGGTFTPGTYTFALYTCTPCSSTAYQQLGSNDTGWGIDQIALIGQNQFIYTTQQTINAGTVTAP